MTTLRFSIDDASLSNARVCRQHLNMLSPAQEGMPYHATDNGGGCDANAKLFAQA